MDISLTLFFILIRLFIFILFLCGIAVLLGMVVGVFTDRHNPQIRTRRAHSANIIEMSLSFGESLTWAFLTSGGPGAIGGDWLDDRRLLSSLKAMRPAEFEAFVARMFSALGYDTKVTGGSGDGGIDIVMTKDGRLSVVQCKKFITRKVTPHDVRDFYGAMGDRSVDGKGFFITTNIFTFDAERFAEGKPMELIDGNKLIGYVRESGLAARLRDEHIQDSHSETCPKCGKVLIVRTNRNDGSSFWACPRYPTCRFTKPC